MVFSDIYFIPFRTWTQDPTELDWEPSELNSSRTFSNIIENLLVLLRIENLSNLTKFKI